VFILAYKEPKTGEGENSQGSWTWMAQSRESHSGIHFAHLPLTSPQSTDQLQASEDQGRGQKSKEIEQKQDRDDKKSNDETSGEWSGPVHPRMRLMRLLRPLGLVWVGKSGDF
jgi:hypothetical protein